MISVFSVESDTWWIFWQLILESASLDAQCSWIILLSQWEMLCILLGSLKKTLFYLPLTFCINGVTLQSFWQNSFVRLHWEHPKDRKPQNIRRQLEESAHEEWMGLRASWSHDQTSNRIPSGLGTGTSLQSGHHEAFPGFFLVWFSGCHFSTLTNSLFHIWPALISGSDFWIWPCCHDYKSWVLTQPGIWMQFLNTHSRVLSL